MSDEIKNTEKLDETTGQAEVACDKVKETNAVDEAAAMTESAGQDPEKQPTNNQSTEPDFGMGLLLGACLVVVFFLMMFSAFNSGASETSGTEERLATCEQKIADLEAAASSVSGSSIAGVESTPTEAPEPSSTGIAGVAIVVETPQPSATATAKPTKKPKATQKPKSKATLSPAQIDYFCEVLMIETNGSRKPAKWDSPEDCAMDYWTETWWNTKTSDESKHLEDWYKVAAHPATTSTLLHYVAYRCDDDWISKKDDAVKLAKLVLTNKHCDDQCLGYLSASDYQSVRDLVYERLLG